MKQRSARPNVARYIPRVRDAATVVRIVVLENASPGKWRVRVGIVDLHDRKIQVCGTHCCVALHSDLSFVRRPSKT